MSSMIRTFARQMAREGKEIRIVKGVRQYAKIADPQKHAPRSKKFKPLFKRKALAGGVK